MDDYIKLKLKTFDAILEEYGEDNFNNDEAYPIYAYGMNICEGMFDLLGTFVHLKKDVCKKIFNKDTHETYCFSIAEDGSAYVWDKWMIDLSYIPKELRKNNQLEFNFGI